jgi:ribosomal protein S18 acetylase RimI-like enzyme
MTFDIGGGFALRQAIAADHPALSAVCLKTGDAGRDASSIEDDPALLGLVFALPYQVLEPDYAFVIESDRGVAGYLFGALDTYAFNERLAAEWYSKLRQRVADPGADNSQWHGSDWLRHHIHHADFKVPEALAPYASHGHIDLLPEARGKGVGRRAVTFLEQRLAAAGSRGVHMQVDPRNENALRFYEAIGFQVLRKPGLPRRWTFMVKSFAARP